MSRFPWKTAIAGAAVLAATAYAYAQYAPGANGPMTGDMAQMHQQMMQGQGGNGPGMHGAMMHGQGMHGGMHGQLGAAAVPTMPGQDAFGAIQEVVRILEADPNTDWSKVNIDALREHLIDMNEVTLHAKAVTRVLDNGIEIAVSGEGRTREAILRMIPAHVAELREIGWNAKAEPLPDGVRLTVLASEAQPLSKLKALGFMGILVQGAHHQFHHLMMAKGEFAH